MRPLPGNYSIPGVTVSTVTYNSSTFVATLTLTGSQFNTPYTATVSSVRDVTNTLTITAPGNTFAFIKGSTTGTFTPGPSLAEPPVHASTNWNVSDTPFGPPGGATTFPTEGFNVGFN